MSKQFNVQTLYKCRMCGEVFSTVTITQSAGFDKAIDVTINGYHQMTTHSHADGADGIADYVGNQRVNDTECNQRNGT